MTDREEFEAERLAIGFCESRSYKERSKEWRQCSDAFTTGYRLAQAARAGGEVEPMLSAWVLFDNSEVKKYIKKYDDGSLAIFDTETEAKIAKRKYPHTDYKRVDYYTDPQPTSCVGCEGTPAPENSPCAVCGQQSLPCQECGGNGAGGEHEEDCTMAQPVPDVTALVEALESLLDMQDEDCRYDHQGYCQNHNLDHVEDGCRVARAKTALAAHRKGEEVWLDSLFPQ